MKSYSRLFLVAFIFTCPFFLFASPTDSKDEWLGQWNMNHDGFVGTLTVYDTKADCSTSVWCNMGVTYIDTKGNRVGGTIEKIDDNWQHMVFYLNFPGNRQKFDSYLFSWDKLNMAGTTYWGGRTFGFYATKRKITSNPIVHISPKVRPSLNQDKTIPSLTPDDNDKIIARRIIGDSIETKFASGMTRFDFKGGFIIIHPDGTKSEALAMQTPEYVPPTIISDKNIVRWLANIQQTLLDMIKEELLGDQVSIDNITRNESKKGLNMYQVINNRFYFLNFLNNRK